MSKTQACPVWGIGDLLSLVCIFLNHSGLQKGRTEKFRFTLGSLSELQWPVSGEEEGSMRAADGSEDTVLVLKFLLCDWSATQSFQGSDPRICCLFQVNMAVLPISFVRLHPVSEVLARVTLCSHTHRPCAGC